MDHIVVVLAWLLCAVAAVWSAHPLHESSSPAGGSGDKPRVHVAGVNRGSSQGTVEAQGAVGGTRGGMMGGINESVGLSPDHYRDRIR